MPRSYMSLTLDEAKRMLSAAEAKAASFGIAYNIAVVDACPSLRLVLAALRGLEGKQRSYLAAMRRCGLQVNFAEPPGWLNAIAFLKKAHLD